MLYIKLVLRNLKRSIKEYMIFMITMCISSMLLYSYNCIMISQELQLQMSSSGGITEMFVFISIIMVLIFAWLVSYISKFMLKHRSKEFGLYLLTGMKRTTVANMFVLEMFAMGFVAFLIGSLMGVCFYQILETIIMKAFDKSYYLSIQLSPNTFALSFLYYVMMWILTLVRQRRSIMKVNIHTLLYDDVQNERVKKNRVITSLQVLMFLTCFLLGMAFFKQAFLQLVQSTSDSPGGLLLAGITLLIISIYAFYYMISNFLQGFFQKRKKLKYRGTNLLMYGHIMGRLRSNRIVLGTLSLLTVISLMMITFTIQYKDMVEETGNTMYPYDIQISNYQSEKSGQLRIDRIRDFLKKKGYVVKDAEIKTYSDFEVMNAIDMKTNLKDAYLGTTIESLSSVSFLKESEFRHLLELQAKELPEPLQENEFGISMNSAYKEQLEPFLPKVTLSIQGQTQSFAFVNDVQIGQFYLPLIFIVPDSVLEGVEGGLQQYIAKTEPETALGLSNDLIEQSLDGGGMLSVKVRIDDLHEGMSSYLIMTFALLYLAFVFICVQATILATQQMMDVEKNQYIYKTIHKIGMNQQEVYRLLIRQIGLYFFIPLLLPIIYVIPLLPTMDSIFNNVITTTNIYQVFFGALLIYLVIYVCYFLLAYIGCKRTMQKE